MIIVTAKDKIPQTPAPDEPGHAQRDPEHPTSSSPDSPQKSGAVDAEHAGKVGPDAADEPVAKKKSEGESGSD